MIGRLRGIVADKTAEGVLVDVQGIGYEVAVPLSTLAQLPKVGSETSLWIHTHVREDELRLFGFSSKQDRTAFVTLLKISGVGPKVALAVLGALSGEALAQAVQTGDTARLQAIPGIGKKTAERILLELGGKLSLGDAQAPVPGDVWHELDGALRNLGFRPADTQKALKALQQESDTSTEFAPLLKRALALLQTGK